MLTVRPRPLPRALRGQHGVGLIEVLVAVVILAIGLLGLAGLQMHTLRDNESAFERGMAVIETHSIVDAMRADRTNAINGQFNIALTDSTPTGTSFAQTALANWRGNLTTMLGSTASGAVACNGSDCTITVAWDDSRGSGGSNTFSIKTEVQL
jgi:type IV pilus assembly protein PilV